MNIIILNGSPRPKGNTTAMKEAFVAGAKDNNVDSILAVGGGPVCDCAKAVSVFTFSLPKEKMVAGVRRSHEHKRLRCYRGYFANFTIKAYNDYYYI